jgi:acetylornithine deacetylase/succinyl-diaminopimelate desuccinylase-like protein
MRPTLWFALAAGLCAQDITFGTVEPDVIEQRFARVQKKNDQRAAVLREMFAEAGCGAGRWSEEKVRDSKLPNLICTLPGATDRRVVVTAHYDKVSAGEGAIDNWSGASLLPSLYQALTSTARNLTFVFVLTIDEEKGLYGATDFVRKLSKEQVAAIVAEVNIDSIGLPGSTKVWVRRADPGLVTAAALVASALKVKIDGVNVDGAGDTDSHPFADRKIPVIDFHSLTGATFPILHTSKDIQAVHDAASYYDTFRLLTGFLAYLDVRPEPQK